MSYHELLTAISDMMDTKLKPISNRLDRIEQTQESGILPRMANLEHSQERLEQSYERLEQSYERLEQSYERIEQSYERIEQSYERLEQTQERNILPRLEKMEQSYKKIELTLENNILPRLQTIEGCYLSTFERYQSGVRQIENMQNDIDVIKTTIENHSKILQKLA